MFHYIVAGLWGALGLAALYMGQTLLATAFLGIAIMFVCFGLAKI
jgi:hypothetical protein